MTVKTDITAGRNLRAAQAQFAALDAFNLLCEVDCGEHVLANQLAVGGGVLLSKDKASREKRERDRDQDGDQTARFPFHRIPFGPAISGVRPVEIHRELMTAAAR